MLVEDSFLLQNDPDLLFTQKMAKKYSGGIGGDVLVIRASGSDGYNSYFFSELVHLLLHSTTRH